MVNMCMCQQNVVNLIGWNRDLLVLIQIRSLLHTTVYQNVLSARIQVVAAACYLVSRPYKTKFHAFIPFFFSL